MRYFLLFSAVIALTFGHVASAAADEGSAPMHFAGSTAHTVAPGDVEVGLFGPVRLGLTDRIEISGHPLWFFVAPNIRGRLAIDQEGPLQLSWNLGLTYPTPLLRLLSRGGAGGILPAGREVPQIISIFNEAVATYDGGAHQWTAALGLQSAPSWGSSQLISIDLPLVYGRMAAFFGVGTLVARVGAQGSIWGPVGYRAELRGFAYPGVAGGMAAEHRGMLRWQPAPHWLVEAGYLLSYGGYPFGNQFDVLPTLDVARAF